MDENNKKDDYVFWAEEAATQETVINQGPINYGSAFAATGEDDTKKKKKKGGFGKKATKFVAVAVAFGLIAGLTFQGVNRVSNSFFPTNETASTENVKVTTPLSSTDQSVGTSTSTDLTKLVENTMPSIVSITSTMTQDYSYFGQAYSQEYDGSGSGIIVGQSEDEILIVTNNHVVEGAKAIAVNFIDDTVHEAKIKGTDSTADLAVVAVKTKEVEADTLAAIKIASLGNSDDVKVGQMAIAIGNALGSGQSVTVGYISAKNRQVNTSSTSQGSQLELLQTDAAINPGNSGGALLNVNGEVIGINDMKYADTEVEGMGYAIPISEATPIINELMNREVLEDAEKGYLGLTGNNISEDNNYYDMPIGVYVYEVAKGGAAEEAGIKKGDIITKINGSTTKTIEAVQEKVNNTRAGTKITVTIMRSTDGEYKEQEVNVTLKDSSTLEKLKSSTANKNQEQQSGNAQVPEQGQSEENEESQSNQDINDQLQEFFNQFN